MNRTTENDIAAGTGVIVDVDDLGTWPTDVTTLVQGYADTLREADEGENRKDLVMTAGHLDVELERMLRSRRLRAYHCTRLLDHEAADVRARGLRPLNGQLVADRLQAAVDYGYLTAKQREVLDGESRLGPRAEGAAVHDQVCLVPSTAVFRYDAHGIDRLLATWGGEAIYWEHADPDARSGLYEVLRALGTPTIVQVQLDVSHIGFVAPCLAGPFVATAAGWPEERGADIFYHAPVPGAQVEALWQPGDERYDRFPDLPH